jgi:hypothetical protein
MNYYSNHRDRQWPPSYDGYYDPDMYPVSRLSLYLKR